MGWKLCAVIAMVGCVLCAGCGEVEMASKPAETAPPGSPARSADGYSSAPDDADRPTSPDPKAAAPFAAASPQPAREPVGKAEGTSSPAPGASKEGRDKSWSMPSSATHDEARAELAAPEPSPSPVVPRSRRPNRHVQSGTLTAGSFDDHDRFEDYQQFLSDAMQQDAHEVLPRVERGRRVVISVVDSQGKPVGDARVVVRHVGSQSTVLDVGTAADGRVFLMADRGKAEQLEVSITPPDGSAPITETIDGKRSLCRVTLPETTAELPRRLDLALVVDTTGSMADELEYLKVEIDDIAETIHRMFPNVDQRYALILYRDQQDSYVTRCHDFTGSLSEFRSTLADQSASGGGDYPEAMHLALEQAGKLDWRDHDTARVLFLVGDAPPHDQFAGRTIDALQGLRNQCIRVFPTAASGVQLKAEFIMRVAAFLTQGKYLFLTDHSGVGNPHAKPHVPDYQVEHLNRLMIRMIASELSGRRLAPEEVVAMEGGALPGSQPVEEEPGQSQRREQSGSAAVPQPQGDVAWSRIAKAGPFAHLPRWTLLAVIAVALLAFDAISGRVRS